MKSKMLVVLSTLVMALGLMAQNTTQTPTPPASDNSKACACCSHDKADGKMSCCAKDGKCGQISADGKDAPMSHDDMMSKDGKSRMKCPMMAENKDGKMSCCGKDGGCCKDGKCDMTKSSNNKSCCDGKRCERPATGM